MPIDNTKASTIAESIKDVVVGLNLSISNCKDQAYHKSACAWRPSSIMMASYANNKLLMITYVSGFIGK
jgi:hypothetical protein